MQDEDSSTPTPGSEPTWTPEQMDEREEVELRRLATKAAEAMGADAFYDAVLQFNLSIEDYLRETCPPNHPGLKMIDRYRAEQAAEPWKNS